jgi:hypothetical protein
MERSEMGWSEMARIGDYCINDDDNDNDIKVQSPTHPSNRSHLKAWPATHDKPPN